MNWTGDFQISMRGRTLADFSFQVAGSPPGGEPYAVVGERRDGGRSALIRADGSFFDRISARTESPLMLKACMDLMQGFERAHCAGKSMLEDAGDGRAAISLRIDPMDSATLRRLEEWIWLCRRGPRLKFTMRGCRMEGDERLFREAWDRSSGVKA